MPGAEPWAPPPLLWCLGDFDLLERLRAERTLAIAGSARACAYGRSVARALSAELADAGILMLVPHAEGSARRRSRARLKAAAQSSPLPSRG